MTPNDFVGPLPEPHAVVDIWGHDCPQYTREQMRAYAAQEVAAERKRCAAKCRRPAGWLSDAQQQVVDDIRRAIESGA